MRQKIYKMYIKSVNIRNIRALKSVKMQWQHGTEAGWHVIIGDNGAGKTTLLKSIALALIGDKRAEKLLENWTDWVNHNESFANIFLELSHDNTDKIYNKLRFENINNKAAATILVDERSFNLKSLAKKSAKNWQNETDYFSAAYSPRRNFVDKDNIDVQPEDNPVFSAHLSCLKNGDLADVKNWIKKFLLKGENGAKFIEFLKKLLESEGLLPPEVSFYKINQIGELKFQTSEGLVIDTAQLSNGYAAVISLLLDLVFRLTLCYSETKILKLIESGQTIIDLSGVVLIDEIDIHLHPSWQIKIGEWFMHYFPNIQFIVSTHSPLICRACGKKGTIWRISNETKTKVEQITGIERDKLVYGNILDAVSTNLFGKGTSISTEAIAMMKELAVLNTKFLLDKITETEKQKRKYLLQIFASDEKN